MWNACVPITKTSSPSSSRRPCAGSGIMVVRLAGRYWVLGIGDHEEARWSPLPGSAGTSYHQVMYRVLTRKEGQRGAFVLRTFVSGQDFLHYTRRAIEQTIDHARFTVFVDGNPARGSYRT